MHAFEKQEAWQTTHQFVLACWKAMEPIAEQEPELSHRLCYVTMRAGGRLAFASVLADKPSLFAALGHASGYISEAAYLLEMLRTMGCLPEQTWRDLHSLRGRAAFQIDKWFKDSLALPELPDPLADDDWDDGPEDWSP